MNPTLKTIIILLGIMAISACMLILPYEQMGLALNVVQVRVVAMFVFAALMWILEPIPVWATSVLLIQLCLFTASDQSLAPFRAPRINEVQLTQVIEKAALQNPEQKDVSVLISSSYAELSKMTKISPEDIRTTLESKFQEAAMPAAAASLYTPELKKEVESIECINVMQYKSLLATFADPIIILFLGGFFLAAAATKYKLDINLANIMLRPFGHKPRNVMLGLMTITAIFAMFMSNTATTAMMIALVAPVLALFKEGDRGRIGFALCIPAAANIGGMGTPIGTPPNAIALKAMQDIGLDISFGKWMVLGVPFVLVMVLVAWLLLLKLYPCQQEELRLRVKESFIKTPQAFVVYITFIVTIALWVMGSSVHGLNSNVIAFIPITVFCVTRVITEKDLANMKWEVLWLVAGGFALGLALQETGLAKDLIGAIPFETWSIVGLLVGAGFICMFMSTFMSNTATANLLIPILASLAGVMIGAGVIDQAWGLALLVGVALAASMGMALPISTPPNALAYATGMIKTKDMAITGTILCLIGFALACVTVIFFRSIGFFA